MGKFLFAQCQSSVSARFASPRIQPLDFAETCPSPLRTSAFCISRYGLLDRRTSATNKSQAEQPRHTHTERDKHRHTSPLELSLCMRLVLRSTTAPADDPCKYLQMPVHNPTLVTGQYPACTSVPAHELEAVGFAVPALESLSLPSLRPAESPYDAQNVDIMLLRTRTAMLRTGDCCLQEEVRGSERSSTQVSKWGS